LPTWPSVHCQGFIAKDLLPSVHCQGFIAKDSWPNINVAAIGRSAFGADDRPGTKDETS
jgi:hypothetical protein